MARAPAAPRIDPRQISIWDLLGDPGEVRRPQAHVAPAAEPREIRLGPPPAPEPEPGAAFAHEPVPVAGEQDPLELLIEMVEDATPAAIPSFVSQVISAAWVDGVLVGRLKVWDGACCCLRATPAPGGYRTEWDHHGLQAPYYEGARRAWRRGPPEVDPDDDDPIHEPIDPAPAPARNTDLHERVQRRLALHAGTVLAALHGAPPPGEKAAVADVLYTYRATTGDGYTGARVRLADGTVGTLWIGRVGDEAEAVGWQGGLPCRWYDGTWVSVKGATTS